MKRTLGETLTIKVTTFACLMAGIVGLSPILKAVIEPAGTESVSKLLSDAKSQSYQISVDADRLDTFVRQTELAWQTHANELSRMKEDVNTMGKTVVKLQNAKAEAAPWQVAAIDRIVPYLQEIAGDTTAAIEYLNKHQSEPKTIGDYKSYIEANADESSHLASLVANFVDYGNSHERSHNLRKTLELPAR